MSLAEELPTLTSPLAVNRQLDGSNNQQAERVAEQQIVKQLAEPVAERANKQQTDERRRASERPERAVRASGTGERYGRVTGKQAPERASETRLRELSGRAAE